MTTLEDRYVITDAGEEAITRPPYAFVLEDLPLEAIWGSRQKIDDEIKALRDRKTAIDQELSRRINEANPDFSQLSPGSASTVGDGIEVKVTWSRTYQWDAAALAECRQYLTQPEYDSLVKVKVEGNGTVYNKLLPRGGALAETLQRARVLSGATPKFEAKKRAQ